MTKRDWFGEAKMINIEILRNKYSQIIFFGAVNIAIQKYVPYFGENDFIVDSNEKKQGTVLWGKNIKNPEKLSDIKKDNSAVIIMSLNYENDIYNKIRSIGFDGDVYSDDMISFNNEDEAFVEGQYTVEKHTQILIALLKKYGVKDIVVSPGVCNMNFVYSVMHDKDFEIWSCIDERSAAYMACGMANATGNPVALSCTGATASRNYMSALTEAFYSHLPIIAITSSRDSYMIGNDIEQVTDRLHLPADVVKGSIEIDDIHNCIEKKYCELKINRCLSMLRMHGGGPVHINLITHFSKDFRIKTLPRCKKIETIGVMSELPEIYGKVGVYIRPNSKITKKTEFLIDLFCKKYNAVVIGDNLSNYKGMYFINYGLFANESEKYKFDILIYTGTINRTIDIRSEWSWRVSEDGSIKDSFLNQQYMFDMPFDTFLKKYINTDCEVLNEEGFYDLLKSKQEKLNNKFGDLPFSSMWVAQTLSKEIPCNSVCYFGIFSSLRNWNYFELDSTVDCYSTVGGYGIDGTLSSMIGSSFVKPNTLHFCIIGDLSLLYDLNSVGNRHIGSNVRILLINNNGGNSLMYNNGLPCDKEVDTYVAAKNHFGNSDYSTGIFESYFIGLGFKYFVAETKEAFLRSKESFLKESEKPILFEIKINENDEFKAVQMVQSIKE